MWYSFLLIELSDAANSEKCLVDIFQSDFPVSHWIRFFALFSILFRMFEWFEYIWYDELFRL